ncbi:MAG: branched-chain amino acid ABC transporter permease [Actinobacteria bacterium]|nr:branched-chain amino acid ABC transporter permease [Actinomycetota bacterium]
MTWVNVIVQGVLLGGLYALYATGLSLVFGVMRMVNLAHGDLSILAAFICLLVVGVVDVNPLLALVVVVPLVFLVGYLLQRFLLNFTLKGDDMRPLLATFGLSVIIQNGLLQGFSADSRGLDAGRIENASLALGDKVAFGWFPLLILVVSVLVIVLLNAFLTRTQLGRAFRATSDDQGAARLMGIDNKHIYALAMGIALAIVALAGVLMGIRTTFTPGIGPARLVYAFEAVIMGGLGSSWGTLVGGIMLGVAQTVGFQLSPGWGIFVGHLVFVTVLAIRPSGLFAKTVS